MNVLYRHTPETVLPRLEEELHEQLSKAVADKVSAFAQSHYSKASRREMASKRIEEIYGATVECWNFIQQVKEPPKVKVFNPGFEEDGWQSTHTIVVICQRDMPFLIDSVRMEVNRRGLTIHTIYNSILATRRSANGELQELQHNDHTESGYQPEALIYLEIDRHTDDAQLADLRETLLQVLAEVSQVTSDFVPMKDRAKGIPALLENLSPRMSKVEYKELVELVEWLADNHFTFLGYIAYKAVTQDKRVSLQPVSGSALGLFNLLDTKEVLLPISELPSSAAKRVSIENVLSFSKSPTKSRVHRPAYSDYIGFKTYDAEGNLLGEHRFMGLYTSLVYYQHTDRIPVIRRKVNRILNRAKLLKGSHDWKALEQILQSYPRDELFQTSSEELFHTAMGILQINERRQTRLFMRRDLYSHYYSCLVYTPREIYNTDFRLKVQAILSDELGSEDLEFTTHFSESVLARTHFIVHVDERQITAKIDPHAIEERVMEAARSWTDEFATALVEAHGEEEGIASFGRFNGAFPSSYRDHFSPRTGVADVHYLQQLSADNPLAMSIYRELEQTDQRLNVKLFHYRQSLPLSDVIPVMENLGLKVIDEHPYAIKASGAQYWIHDFGMVYNGHDEIDIHRVRDIFQQAFDRIWKGLAASDRFNRLVLSAQLDWRSVSMLRAYAAYIKQLKFGISQAAMANCLVVYGDITKRLVELFTVRFKPGAQDEPREQQLQDEIIALLEGVPSLTDDRIIRRYLDLIMATLRTNFYQTEANGDAKLQISLKFSPRTLADIPKPKPLYEIFVYSPRMQGLHLRGGKVARGGLRWSDRTEDYRTEVLGLVKAQQVKNAVIVPVGAKGGFVAHQLFEGMSREDFQAEGIACYRLFIRGLLDITDNIVNGEVVPPTDVIRHDEDDPYLVVAADKGTATFSDIANEIALEYGFWLGDAFASGGSQGYDHKKMGITARGAWVSVERHFREMGHNVATEPFTVIGIGDMSGDVFGNGMLLSRCIRLVAAFNHLHIFIDPDPDETASFAERQRLFELPRSSWADYDEKLISKGGGIFSRSAKSITITAEMKRRFNISRSKMTPNELLHVLLQAPVDLLWNGGIGTYVKSSEESDGQVGDKANDSIRVNADQLRCRVIGEGGNLGMTQRARMEYCLKGGACNTDFIDNAGGVDCSDHEVNAKILLDAVMTNGELTLKQRNNLLREMTEQVAELVLFNNYQQTQAISLVQAQTVDKMVEYRQLINHLEQTAKLDRSLEFIPSDDELVERRTMGQGLTRPEIAILVSYSKSHAKEILIDSDLPEDPYISRELETAFPAELMKRYPDQIYQHKLKREIIVTQVANQMVNQMGVSYAYRVQLSTGCSAAAITRAYILARDVFQLEHTWQQITELDNQVDAAVQLQMMRETERLVRRASRWFLRNRRTTLDIAEEVAVFAEPVALLRDNMGQWLQGNLAQAWQDRFENYLEAGVPECLATPMASIGRLYMSLGMIEVARELDIDLERVLESYCVLGERLELYWFSQALNNLNVESQWQALAREAYRDDMEWQGRSLVHSLLQHGTRDEPLGECYERWLQAHEPLVQRWLRMLSDLKSAETQDYSMYTVAIRELFDLAQGTQRTPERAD